MNYFQETRDDFQPGQIRIIPYFDTLSVEKKTEIFVFNFPKFLSAIGGLLGFYLGLSVLSVLYKCLNFCDRLNSDSVNSELLSGISNSQKGKVVPLMKF